MAEGHLILAAGLLLADRVASAQDQEAIRPPRLVFMPEMSVPSELQVPESGEVQAEITVGLDGQASLDRCEAEASVCAVVAEALLSARFEPAQRAGVAVAARIRISLRMPQPVAAQAESSVLSPPPTAAANERTKGPT